MTFEEANKAMKENARFITWAIGMTSFTARKVQTAIPS